MPSIFHLQEANGRILQSKYAFHLCVNFDLFLLTFDIVMIRLKTVFLCPAHSQTLPLAAQ